MEENNQSPRLLRPGLSRILDIGTPRNGPSMDDDFNTGYTLESSDSDESFAAPPPPNAPLGRKDSDSSMDNDFAPAKYVDSNESYGSMADIGCPSQPTQPTKKESALRKRLGGGRRLGINGLDSDSEDSGDEGGFNYQSSDDEEESPSKPVAPKPAVSKEQNKYSAASAFNARSQWITDIVGPKESNGKSKFNCFNNN